MPRSRWLDAAAIATWLVCGLPPIVTMLQSPVEGWIAAVWGGAFVIYGAAMGMVLLVDRRAWPPAAGLIAVQSVSAIVLNVVAARHFGGTGAGAGLFVIVAAELPHVYGPAVTATWLAAQTIVMTLALGNWGSLTAGVTFALAIGGFQLFAATTTFLHLREASARDGLARANAELHATRALLAENARASERVRIARDLHDALGHHLTALSLQLDVTSRLAERPPNGGPRDNAQVAEHVREAHAIAKLLLSDVRSVVSEMRETGAIDIAAAVRTLAESMTGAVAIHLDVPDTLPIDDAAQAHAVLRSVQEIITNAVRHAGARNLWIRVAVSGDGVTLDARDDGRGAASVQWGSGLTGMRERFEEHAGRIDVRTRPDGGFEIHAVMPPRAAS